MMPWRNIFNQRNALQKNPKVRALTRVSYFVENLPCCTVPVYALLSDETLQCTH